MTEQGKIRLRSPRYAVILGDPDLPDTWVEHVIQVIGPDNTRAEMIFNRNKMGKIQDHVVLFADLTAWCALTRRRLIDLEWDEFKDSYIEVAKLDDDDELDAVRPTTPAPGAG